MTNISELVIDYSRLVPFGLLAFIISLLLTPWAGQIAAKVGAIDMPAHLRGRGERVVTRINSKITPRLGGIGLAAGLLIVIAFTEVSGFRWGIVAGIIILTIFGILDDIYDISSSWQFLIQFLVAGLVVISGVTIPFIQVAGITFDFASSTSLIQIGDFIYRFIFPADLITILWIVGIMNFVNWASGIDALNGSLSAIAALTMLLIAMRTGNVALAALIATYLGATLGVLPFNYHPSKIFYGFGEYINGFLLAVFAILSGGKLAIAIVILGLPIVDAVAVMITRIAGKPESLLRPWSLLRVVTTGDRNHLHHKLLDMGFSWKMVLLLEAAIMGVFCTIAFYFSGFSDAFLALILGISGLITLLLVITLFSRRAQRHKQIKAEQAAAQPKVEVKIAQEEETPVEKFTY